MTNRDLDEDVYEFLRRIQLEQFFDKIHKDLHLTRLSHFDHVTMEDLTEINMSKPEQRRLFDALKKVKKRSMFTRLSLTKSKKKRSCPFESSNSVPSHFLKPARVKSCLISEVSITYQDVVGDGAFGVVYKGEWITCTGSKLPVAVKCLKFTNNPKSSKEDDFKREASAMSDLDHPNVIHLYGIVLTTPMQLVMELAPLGSLLDRLQREPEKFLISKLSDFVMQVASGMSYLESKRYVHRDLAARNLLLVSHDRVKIGDFGFMRPLPIDEDIYVMNPLGIIPFAWCAPECLANRQFSHASDVWAFGITVVEIFSYGRQPWPGLNASQILDIVDEPACGRPGKPNHCPDKIYSLLVNHCWAHKPRERSKFLVIEDKLKQVFPEDVTMLFEQETHKSSEMLSAQPGDLITVIAWKSRLGKAFGKGQNKRTRQVGYFPIEQINRGVVKKKSSGSKPKIIKAKDISPPLDNSFSHCAHRGEGKTPNWGHFMTLERQVVGKQVALSLPSKVIPLNNTENQSLREQADAEVKSNDSCSITGIETSSLSSGSSSTSNSSTRGSPSGSSCTDSGYYSNRDICASPDYESMSGSHPITIPRSSNQAVRSRMSLDDSSSAVSSCRQLTPNYDCKLAPSQQFPFPGSPQFHPCRGHRSRSENSECTPVVTEASEIRPPLPLKQRMIGNIGCREQPVAQCHGHDFDVSQDSESTGDKNPYEYINDNIYEDVSSQGLPLVTDPILHISSPCSHYSNNNGGKEHYSPPIPPPRRKRGGKPNPTNICRIPTYANCMCSQKKGRGYSLPVKDSENLIPGRNNGRMLNSFSSFRQLDDEVLNGDLTTLVDSNCWETRSAEEVFTGEAYESMDSCNTATIELPVDGLVSQLNENNQEHPPPLPKKHGPFQRRFCKPSGNESRGTDTVLLNSRDTFAQRDSYENVYDPPIFFANGLDVDPSAGQNYDQRSEIHPYAEITENLPQKLYLGDQNNSGANSQVEESEGNKDLETREEAPGFESVSQCQKVFQEIRKDKVDEDTTLRKRFDFEANAGPKNKLTNCVSVGQLNKEKDTSMDEEILGRPYAADQNRINRDTFTRSQTCEPSTDMSELLRHSSSKTDGVSAQHARTGISFVTAL